MRSPKKTPIKVKKAYIIKRKNRKNYYAKIIFINGKISFYSLKTSNKTQAIKNLNYLINEIEEINKTVFVKVHNIRYNLKDIIKKYLNYRKNIILPSSLVKEKSILFQFYEYFKNINLVDITSEDFYNYKKYLIYKGNKPKTINNHISIIKVFYNYLIDEQIVNENIIKPGKFFMKVNKEHNIIILTKKEIIKIKNEFDKLSLKFKTFFYILLFTGLRISEVRGLNRKNINLKDRYIIITGSKTYDDKKIKNRTKSKSGIRKVPILFDFLIDIFKDYLNENRNIYPFENTSYTYLRTLKNNICKKTGIYFRLHDLRHIFASILIDMGFNIKQLQYIMGHEDIKTTLNIYSHLLSIDFDNEIIKANNYFNIK